MTSHLRLAFVTPLACWLAACGPTPSGDDDDDMPIDARIIDAIGIDAIDGPPEPDPSRVYAHSGTTLYRIDTATMAAIPVGTFTGPMLATGVLDLALDRDDDMIAVTRDQIFRVNPTTAAVTFLADYTGGDLTSLSFVPVNIAAPDGPEMLIAATGDGQVVRIEVVGTTATVSPLGNYGLSGGIQIASSGDLVYIKGVGTFATVDVGLPAGNDFLASVDPANGWRATLIGTGTTFNNIFGVAYWGGRMYGFADDGFAAATGKFIELNQVSGNATLITMGAIRWFGAGVTTEAPLIP